MQSDPIGLGGGLNTYGYVGAAPLAQFDPQGLSGTSSAVKTLCALGLVAEPTPFSEIVCGCIAIGTVAWALSSQKQDAALGGDGTKSNVIPFPVRPSCKNKKPSQPDGACDEDDGSCEYAQKKLLGRRLTITNLFFGGLMPINQYREVALLFNEEVRSHNMLCPNNPVAELPIGPAAPEHMSDRVTTADLLVAGDREYERIRDYLAAHGFELPQDAVAAVSWCLARAKQGDAYAQYAMAKFHLVGLFVEQSHADALRWCRLAAEASFMPAYLMLAGFHEMGWAGLERDARRALELIKSAADLGDAVAQCTLGVMYLTGTEVLPQDATLARRYISSAAQLGDSNAQCHLASILIEQGDKDSVNEAMDLLRRAAAQDNAWAHRRLARYYRDGSFGLQIDFALADHHARAADKLEME